MIEAHEVISAQQNSSIRDDLIVRQSGYICRCASKAAGRFVDEHDDLYSAALLAFNDAVSAYHPDKGNFAAFADRVIRNRVIDQLRREKRSSNVIPFSALSSWDDHGDEVLFDIEDKCSCVSDAAWEISSLTQELKKFDISFFDLPKCSPKSSKTKRACKDVVGYILSQPELMGYIYKKRSLPVRRILTHVKVNEKVLERYRKYIFAGILICSGEYPTMAGYFCG